MPGERTEHDFLAVPLWAGGVEEVPEQEEEGTAVGAILQGECPGGSLRLHGLQQRSEVGLLQRTLSLHLR